MQKPYLSGTIHAVMFCLALLGLAPSARANPQPEPLGDLSLLCDQAAWQAASETGVPISVLKAISLAETGRRQGRAVRPWPWTVNMEGVGQWFDSFSKARAYVEEHFSRGARSFDVGCFQVNYKWHGENFASIDQMFDPLANARYAARFLQSLYAETGSWSSAAGAYHSRSPDRAQQYATRFDSFRNGLLGQDAEAIPVLSDLAFAALTGQPVQSAPRINHYPLLRSGTGSGLGSLVPIANGRGVALFGARDELGD